MRLWVVVLGALIATPAAAQGQKKLALVLGNAAYSAVPALANPRRDADAMAEALRAASFEVVSGQDLDLAGMKRAVEDFVARINRAGPGTIATVYYAGHAVQLDGANFLLPVDSRIGGAADLRRSALGLSEILRQLDASRAVAKVVILDACRDNPFQSSTAEGPRGLSLVDTGTEGLRSASNETGLARIESRGGTLVAFSTSPGATALDGTGQNSPYTEALLRAMREPGLSIEEVFRRVRVAVHDSTQGAQLPWETSSLTTRVSFVEPLTATPQGGPAAPTLALAPPRVAPSAAQLRSLSPAQAYRVAIEWDRPAVYEAYLQAYPDDSDSNRVYRLLGNRREQTAFAAAVRDGSREALASFLATYPQSPQAAVARRLATRAPTRQAQLAAACPVPPPVRTRPGIRQGAAPRPSLPRPTIARPPQLPFTPRVNTPANPIPRGYGDQILRGGGENGSEGSGNESSSRSGSFSNSPYN